MRQEQNMSNKSFGETFVNGHVDACQENEFLRQSKSKSDKFNDKSMKQVKEVRVRSGKDELRNPQSLSPNSRIRQ